MPTAPGVLFQPQPTSRIFTGDSSFMGPGRATRDQAAANNSGQLFRNPFRTNDENFEKSHGMIGTSNSACKDSKVIPSNMTGSSLLSVTFGMMAKSPTT